MSITKEFYLQKLTDKVNRLDVLQKVRYLKIIKNINTNVTTPEDKKKLFNTIIKKFIQGDNYRFESAESREQELLLIVFQFDGKTFVDIRDLDTDETVKGFIQLFGEPIQQLYNNLTPDKQKSLLESAEEDDNFDLFGSLFGGDQDGGSRKKKNKKSKKSKRRAINKSFKRLTKKRKNIKK